MKRQKEMRSLFHKAVKVSIKTAKELEKENQLEEKLVLSGINILVYYGGSALFEYDFSGTTSGEHKTVNKIIYANMPKEEEK